MSAYQQLEEHFEQVSRLGEVLAVLRWDNAAMMPTGGAEARSEQVAMLQGMRHELLTEPAVSDLLDSAEEEADELGDWQRANLREMRRNWLHANCVPAGLVRQLSRKGSKCETVWRSARADDDFERLEPHLQEVLDLVREVATIKGDAFDTTPYDALLDRYEPGISSEQIDAIFGGLAGFIPGFLEEVLEYQRRRPETIRPEGPFEQPRQKQLAEEMMAAFGFDFDHGRLDSSHHPFCGGYPEDVRLTTFYNEDNFLRATMAVLHETGHALYSRGLPVDWRRQPVGKARGMAVHESQSLFVEMQIGRSKAFSQWAAPLYRNAFDGQGDAWSADNLYRLNTTVERSLIRVDADEVTYPAHVILRYRLEKAMIGGELVVQDLPQAWNEGMEELVGVVPDSHRDGCMQDIHWMDGTFGYFPTYTLGALIAAQLYDSATEAVGDVDDAIANGEFAPLLDWLEEHIHSVGCRLETDDLLEEATGHQLDATHFKNHLRERYLGRE